MLARAVASAGRRAPARFATARRFKFSTHRQDFDPSNAANAAASLAQGAISGKAIGGVAAAGLTVYLVKNSVLMTDAGVTYVVVCFGLLLSSLALLENLLQDEFTWEDRW